MNKHKNSQLTRMLKGIVLLLAGVVLSGCGAIQSAKEGTVSVAKAIFVKQIHILHLDFAARAQLNPGDEEAPASLMIRVYQLGKVDNFDKATYQELLEDDYKTLSVDLLARNEVVLYPASAVSLDVPMNQEADYVGIVALFRKPDLTEGSWKVVIKRSELDADKPRLLIANYDAIGLVPLK
ncbi:Uncharacterized protein conserved in bacteria [Pragia fontium]|uniref:type VI secretion system lipoprotein TssJ n=1 Tax=Pragia fontium TaxID=82985 RepID=UPI000E065CDD|nr:type VI secretion system lipoprotein TssJ [Pragia fontium]SUB82358.1 Uncharacterized protein conserved in bacteria [Pragia fontium]